MADEKAPHGIRIAASWHKSLQKSPFQMDKKSIIGIVLIFLIVLGFSYFNRPSDEEVARAQRQRDSVAAVQATQEAEQLAIAQQKANDSLAASAESPHATDSIFLANDSLAAQQPAELYLVNDNLSLQLSTKGGQITTAQLRGFHTYYGDSLLLFHGQGNSFGLQFWAGNSHVSTAELPFRLVGSASDLVASKPGDTARVTLRLQTQQGGYLEYLYTLPYGGYSVGLQIRMYQMDALLAANQRYVDLSWTMRSPQQERGLKKEAEATLLAYQTPNGDFEEINQKDEPVTKKVETKVEWLAFKEQFFSAILRAPVGFEQPTFTLASSDRQGYVKDFSALLMLPIDGGKNETYSLEFYLGPNLYKSLKAQEHGYERIVPLGSWIVRWINKYIVINVFDFLSRYITSYGLIILILTVLIKLVLFPLTFKSYKSQAKMRVLKPMVDEVNAKYPRKEDAMKKQQAVMALYKRAGVSPMGGCLPMLIQFPFLIAMFRFFPASFELRQKSFLWADDLSSYDSVLQLPFNIPFYGDHVSLFTLLMAASLITTSLISYKQTASSSPQMPGMKFMMLYMMPIMMLLWFNDYSSGLSYYYLLANLITIAQTLVIRRTIDEKALLARLQQNAATPPKKSGFMARLEKMQQEQQRRVQQSKKR